MNISKKFLVFQRLQVFSWRRTNCWPRKRLRFQVRYYDIKDMYMTGKNIACVQTSPLKNIHWRQTTKTHSITKTRPWKAIIIGLYRKIMFMILTQIQLWNKQTIILNKHAHCKTNTDTHKYGNVISTNPHTQTHIQDSPLTQHTTKRTYQQTEKTLIWMQYYVHML